jgi:LysM repeat protein
MYICLITNVSLKLNKINMTNKFFYTILISAGFFLLNSSVEAKILDSIGTKMRNGKVYIIHEVDKGQGAYSVAKKYGLSIEALVKENPSAEKGLVIGQLLYIPTGKTAPFEEPLVKEYFASDKKKEEVKTSESKNEEKTTFAQYHVVEASETLFSIAQKYNTSVEIIKSLNGLTTDELSIGSKLLVPFSDSKSPEKKEIIEAKAETKVPTVEVPKEVLVNTQNKDKEIEEIKKKYSKESAPVDQGKVVVAKGTYTKKVENMPEFDVEKVTEIGKATFLSSENVNQNKNVAYHYEAPDNTIIMVTNPANNKAVFVKVVGNFSFDAQKGEVIKLSNAAMEQIGLKSDSPVEISYAR